MIQQIDPEGSVVNYVYDTEGRLIKTVDGNGNDTDVDYSSSSGFSSCSEAGNIDQPSAIIYPTFTKKFAYDSRNRKVKEIAVLTDIESYTTEFGYDLSGNMVMKIDKEGKTTNYTYDSLNRLTTVIDALDGTTAYTYDSRDNLIALTDAKNQTTRFEYHRNNRLVKEIRPMGEETSYAYDEAGNLVSKIDAKNQKAEYGYDDVGRLTAVMYFNPGDPVNPVKTFNFGPFSLTSVFC
jgi:YD repeat-containing protein